MGITNRDLRHVRLGEFLNLLQNTFWKLGTLYETQYCKACFL